MFYKDTYDSRVGPTMPIQIGTEQGPQHRTVKGLIDTGSDYCALPPEIAQDLSLVSSSRVPVSSAHGQGISRAFFVTVRLPRTNIWHPVGALECIRQEGFDVLIGRNILRLGLLKLTADWFSFSIES